MGYIKQKQVVKHNLSFKERVLKKEQIYPCFSSKKNPAWVFKKILNYHKKI